MFSNYETFVRYLFRETQICKRHVVIYFVFVLTFTVLIDNKSVLLVMLAMNDTATFFHVIDSMRRYRFFHVINSMGRYSHVKLYKCITGSSRCRNQLTPIDNGHARP